MSKGSEAIPIEQRLKTLLRAAIVNPPEFERAAISQPSVHRRLLSDDYDIFVDPNSSRVEQAMQTFEVMVLSSFVASLDAVAQSPRESQ